MQVVNGFVVKMIDKVFAPVHMIDNWILTWIIIYLWYAFLKSERIFFVQHFYVMTLHNFLL